MEIVYATVLGLAVGAVLRYALPGRSSYGMLLLPAIGAIAGAAAWAAATWIGWKPDGGWIWVAAVVVPAIVTAVAAVLLHRVRLASDEERLRILSSGRQA